MKLSHLILTASFLSTTQVNGLPASSDSVAAGPPSAKDPEPPIPGSKTFGKIQAWFGIGDEDRRVVDILGKMECDSDNRWRESGWCAKAGRAFPKDGGISPNPMEPILMPAIPNHLADWETPKTKPEDLFPFKPPTPPACPPIKGYGNKHHERPIADGNPWEIPYQPWTGGFDVVLTDGSVFHTPLHYPQGKTANQRIEMYHKLCIPELQWQPGGEQWETGAERPLSAPLPPPLLDQAGLDLCDVLEGDLYDAKDDLDEALDLARQYENLDTEEVEEADGLDKGLPKPSNMPKIDGWQDHPEFGKQDPFSRPEDPYLMSGGLGPGDPKPKPIKEAGRISRNFRRLQRKLRQQMKRRTYIGFYDETDAEGMNDLFGVKMDPFISGPGPDDDPDEPRPTEVEKMEEAMRTITDLPFVPMVLPPGYTWVPAEKAEFGDDWERAKRWAELMGRDRMQKAVPERTDIYKMQTTSEYGLPKPYIPKLISLFGFNGAMITPEIYSQLNWRTKRWAKMRPKKEKQAPPWWLKKLFLKPFYRTLKNFWAPGWKKDYTRRTMAIGGIAMMWAIIMGVHFRHERHMEDLGRPFEKFNAPMQKQYAPWIQTESKFTTAIDGTQMVSTVTGLSQYDPYAETTRATPEEVAELMGYIITSTMSTAMTVMTGSDGLPTTITATPSEIVTIGSDGKATTITATISEFVTIGSDGIITTVIVTPATVTAATTAYAIEYAGIYRPPPLTYPAPVSTALPKPPLPYVEPEHLAELAVPADPTFDHNEYEDSNGQQTPRPVSPLQSEDFAAALTIIAAARKGSSLGLPPPSRPHPVGHGPFIMHGPFRNGTFTNGTLTNGTLTNSTKLRVASAASPSDIPQLPQKGAVVNTTDIAFTRFLNTSTTMTNSILLDEPHDKNIPPRLPSHNHTSSPDRHANDTFNSSFSSSSPFPNAAHISSTSTSSSSSSSSPPPIHGPYLFPNSTSLHHHQQQKVQHTSNSTRYSNATLPDGSSGSSDASLDTSPEPQRLNYLRGTAHWRGRVVPEVPDVTPTMRGRWQCEWRPEGL